MVYDPDNWDQEEADDLQHRLEATARRAARLEKKGVCVHGWQQRQKDGTDKCLTCGKVAEADKLFEERDRLIYGG